jgi:hypothetical protein
MVRAYDHLQVEIYVSKMSNVYTRISSINGSSTQQFLLSSSVITATTCFGHTTIIKRRTVVYFLKLLA